MVFKVTRPRPSRLAWFLTNPFRKIIQPPRRLINAARVRSGHHVLDIGCGPGYFTIPLAEKVGRSGSVTVNDVHDKMIRKLRRNVALSDQANVFFQSGELHELELKNEFDVVIMFWVIHEMTEPDANIREVMRLLTPGGRCFIAEPKIEVSQTDWRKLMDLAKSTGLELDSAWDSFTSRYARFIKPQAVE
jgi:ubiquinone/menaquinone biosynthesis C-methylase UbiE